MANNGVKAFSLSKSGILDPNSVVIATYLDKGAGLYFDCFLRDRTLKAIKNVPP